MQARPTTEQILDDLAREVRENIIPAVDDPALVVNLEMMEQLLHTCAVRAANEIAWMAAECADMEAFAADVAERARRRGHRGGARRLPFRAQPSRSRSTTRSRTTTSRARPSAQRIDARVRRRRRRPVGPLRRAHPGSSRHRARAPPRLLLPGPLLTAGTTGVLVQPGQSNSAVTSARFSMVSTASRWVTVMQRTMTSSKPSSAQDANCSATDAGDPTTTCVGTHAPVAGGEDLGAPLLGRGAVAQDDDVRPDDRLAAAVRASAQAAR